MSRSIQVIIGGAILGILSCLPTTATAAPLQRLSSSSGEVRDLLQHATNNNVLFAATQGGGVYKSTDAGASWSRLSGLSERYVWRLAGDPANGQVLYAATKGGLFKTVDGGTTWGRKTYDTVRAIAVNPFNPNHLLIGVPGAGVYTSSDGGTTFAVTNTGLDSLEVTAIAFNPVTSGVVYVGLASKPGAGWGGVFKSSNGGTTWSNWNNPSGSGALGNKFVTALVVTADGSVHAGTFNPATNLGGLYKQTGTGGWSLRQEVYGIEALVLDESAASTVWAGTRFFGPWVTQNNGSTWSQAVNPGLDPDVYTGVHSLLPFPGIAGKVLAGVKGLGLYLTVNNGAAWNTAGAGLHADRARTIIAAPGAPNTLYLGLEGGGVVRSLDGGSTWTNFDTGLEAATVSKLGISGTNPTTIYAATLPGGLFKWNSTASGWVEVAESGLPSTGFLKPMDLVVHPTDDRIVYYSLFDPGQGVYRRNTAGSWDLVLPGSWSGAGASKLVVSPTLNTTLGSTRVHAFMFGSLPYESTNGGSSWTQVAAPSTGFGNVEFRALAENPLNSNTVLASTTKGLFKSVDGGSAWTSVAVSGTLTSTVLSGLVFSPTVTNRVWGVDPSGKYYCSNDGGTSWQTLADPLLGSPIVDLRLINGALYLVTDGDGVLRDAAPACP